MAEGDHRWVLRRKNLSWKSMWYDAVFRADPENDTHFALWTRFGKENRSQYLIFMKNREKSADFWVFRVLFGHKGKLFSQTFYSHFVELEKLYNMCEIQFGPVFLSKKCLWNIENFLLCSPRAEFSKKIFSPEKYVILCSFLCWFWKWHSFCYMNTVW